MLEYTENNLLIHTRKFSLTRGHNAPYSSSTREGPPCSSSHTGPETAILISATISGKIRCVKFCGAVSRVSTTARASENSNPIAKNTRFHASARARPGLFRLSKILCRGQHFLAQQRAHQRIQTQSLHTLDFMQVRVRGLGSHARHATPRGGAAPPRRGAGEACWPMAALLSSVAPIGCYSSDVRGMPPARRRSAAALLWVREWH